MSDPLLLDSLDARLDRAANDLRADDSAALDRIVARTRVPRRSTSRPTDSRPATVRLRYVAAALTVALAGVALWPRGEAGQAQAAMPFDRVQAATLNAPRSTARTYDAKGRLTDYIVWREGAKYASELWVPGHKRLLSETRSDGRQKLFSFQFEASAKAPGYRYATLGAPILSHETQLDTLEGILQSYLVKGAQPEPERIGGRLRYRIHPVWSKKETMTVEADAASGRVLEIRSSTGTRTVIDYDAAIPERVFRPHVSYPDVIVLQMPKLKRDLAADIDAGAGAWFAGDGTLWRVYRGSVQHPPAIPGLRLTGRTFSKSLQRDGVVAVGSSVGRTPPKTVRIGGKTVPVRKIGMIYWWRSLFGTTTP